MVFLPPLQGGFSTCPPDDGWKIIKTLHFDIYYPEFMPDLAVYTAKAAEQSYVYIANSLKHELNIVVSIKIDFRDSMPSGSNSGTMDMSPDRIMLSFNGSYDSYHKELTRKLAYSFQYDILYDPTPGWEITYLTMTSDYPEILINGMAAYLSEGYDDYTDALIRDIIYSGNTDKYFDIAFFRKSGKNKKLQIALFKSLLQYLEVVINRDISADLMLNIKEQNNLYEVIESAAGKNINDLTAGWISYYKQKYATGDTSVLSGGSAYVISSAVDKTMLVLVAVTGSGVDLPLLKKIDKNLIPGKKENVIMYRAGQQAADFQDAFLPGNYPSFSADCKNILLVRSRKGREKIFIYNTESGEKKSEIVLPFLKISELSISPDGKNIVFIGQSYSSADLYHYNITGKKLRRLTDDKFSKRFPKISPDNSFVIYSSNENTSGNIEAKNYKIIKLDLMTNNRSVLVGSNSSSIQADISPDGKRIVYSSNVSGAFEIHVCDIESGKSGRITGYGSTAFSPRWHPDNSSVTFSMFQNFSYKIIKTDANNINITEQDKAGIAGEKTDQYPDPYFNAEDIIIKDYSSGGNINFSAVAGTAVSDNTISGTAGITLSDFLREHELNVSYEFLKNDSDRNNSYYLDYKLLKYRVDFDFGCFFVSNPFRTDYFYNTAPFMFYPANTDAESSGIYGSFSYPFIKHLSASFRVSSVVYENMEEYDNSQNDYFSNEFALSLNYDALIPGRVWPADGTRCGLSYTRSIDGRYGDLSFGIFSFDFLSVFQLTKIINLSIHAGGGEISGEDGSRFKFHTGGIGSLEGNDLYSYSGSRAAFFRIETGITVFDRISLRRPVNINFSDVSIALFADFGSAWDEGFTLMNSETNEFEDMKSDIGAGIRFFMLDHLVFKLDAAWPYYYKSFGDCSIIYGAEVRY